MPTSTYTQLQASHSSLFPSDIITMKYRVKEYWIVNPMLNSITIYALNKEEVYEQHAIKTEQGMITSKLLKGFHLALEHIFQ